ncbi:nucleotide sugar dehydrogenase [Natrialbaceae archaeon A-CW2]
MTNADSRSKPSLYGAVGAGVVEPEEALGADTACRDALRNGEVPVAVYGLGKMGLPLAAVFAEVTGAVTGVDVDRVVVETVNDGSSHVCGEPGLEELVAEQVERNRLAATTDGYGAAADARIHVVIVPSEISEEETGSESQSDRSRTAAHSSTTDRSSFKPDLSTVQAVLEVIAAGLEPGDLVIVESTLPPGTCRDVIHPYLLEESGLETGSFGLAFCPERTASGTAIRDIRGAYPKVVGGVDAESGHAAALLYDELSSNAVHLVSDATTAEAVKVFEGVYRDVNIALANQLAGTAADLDISVREAIETANHIPMCHLHDPGPGVGGHCIPYYPHFLLSQVETPLSLVELARSVNREMPATVVSMIEAELESIGTRLEDATVLVLGFTYRPGVEETRSSPAIDVVETLLEGGATVWGCDPLVDPSEFGARAVTVDELPDHAFDAAVLVTPQDAFDRIRWDAMDPMTVLDGRDVLSLENTDHRVVTLGGARGRQPVVIDSGTSTETGTSTIGRPAAFDAEN